MEEMVEVSIDGRVVEVPKGTLIIDAAERLGIHIPRLCYLKGLENVGICRVCLVQVEGSKRLMPACRTKVKPDMKVFTDTPEVLENRKTVLELILSTHPYECMTCEKSGNCELQRYAYEFGIERSRFPTKEIGKVLMEDEFIRRRLDLCILCGRCVRVCKSHGYYVLDFIQRGMETSVSTPNNLPLREAGCTFCGSCVEVCPVGALVEMPRVAKGREWEFIKKETLCQFCASVCQTYAFLKNGEVIKVTSRNREGLCVKGKFGFDAFDESKRVTSPMIRKDGVLTEVGWEQALDFIAERLNEIKKRDGADAIGFIGSAYFPTEVLYLLQKLARCAIGTNNVDNSSSLYNSTTRRVVREATGALLPPIDRFDISDADCLFLLGADLEESHPVVARRMRKLAEAGIKFIVANPTMKRATESVIHIPIETGKEYHLVSAVLNILLSGKGNKKVEKTEGFKQLCESVSGFTADKVKTLTGVDGERIGEIARIIGESRRLYILFGTGVSCSFNAEGTIRQILNLALLKNASMIPLVFESNAVGAQLAGVTPDSFAYGQPMNRDVVERLKRLWKVSSLPEKEGLSITDMMKGKLKALYLLGDIPLTSLEGVKRPDFLIVQGYRLSGVAEEADVLLPAASVYEEGGTFIDFEGRMKTVESVRDGGVKKTSESLCELSLRLGYKMGYRRGVMAELRRLRTKSRPLPERFLITKEGEVGERRHPFGLPISDINAFLTDTILRDSRVSSFLKGLVSVETHSCER